MIIEHKKAIASFNLGVPDQRPICIYTLLSVNEQHRDCAAYRGAGPHDQNLDTFEREDLIMRIKSMGKKIREIEARELFPEIASMDLKYRW